MANGLADRVDRVRACGNGVVPLVAAYAFLSIHLDGLSVLDFLSFVVSFYLTEQQLFEWEDPT